jgi:hypothetical protein
MYFIQRFMLVTALALLAIPAHGQVSEMPDPLFQSSEALRVSLSGPFTTLIKERPKDEYMLGAIRYYDTDGTPVALDLEIRTRGNFRHQVCDYPPVLLNFKKKQTKGTLFEKQNKLKLVIPCKYSALYEQIILREYLAYRILNTVTDMSFRVRLLRVTFENTEKNLKKPEVRYAFLIEHKKRLGERYGMKDLKIERTAVADIQPDRLNLTSVFAFLIGNTDFSPIAGAPNEGCCHNYVLFRKEKTDPILAIPYDFDQSGFVSAPYATPAEPFNLRSVRQRLYRGRCVNNEYLEGSLQRFRDRRPDIYALLNEQEGLSKKTRKKLVSYVDQFYRLINRPSDVKRYIVDKCV